MTLPVLAGPDTAYTRSVLGQSGARFNAGWSLVCPNRTLVFTLKAGQSIAANERIEVVVPSSFGVRLPDEGVRIGSSPILSTAALDGPVSGLLMPQLPPVGALADVSLEFEPSVGGSSTNVIFRFSPYMELMEGDTVHLYFPANYAANRTCFTLWSSHGQAFVVGNWSNELAVFTFPVSADIGRREQVTIVVPRYVGLELPLEGFSTDAPGFAVAVSAVAGNVLKTIVRPTTVSAGSQVSAGADTPTIAVLRDGTLSFEPSKAAEAVNITISFTSQVSLTQFNRLVVSLPGFTGPASIGGYMSGESGSKFTAIWTRECPDTSITMTLGEGQSIGEGEVVTVVIPASFGITIPVVGIRVNTTYSVTTDGLGAAATLGPPEAIGALLDLSLDFAPKMTSAVSTIILAFEPQMHLFAGDV
eukprot:185929-Rhodomonas_salina.1